LREEPEFLKAKCQSNAVPPAGLENQRDASRSHSVLKFENLTHIMKVISPLGFVGVPATVAGNDAPPYPPLATESDPPPGELYAAFPTSEPVTVPLETKSRQLVAPDVAKLDGLLPSSSKVGEDETAAFAGLRE
jgi:hypothetical protein